MSFRVIISALVVGAISIGNNLQSIMSASITITRWQVISAMIGGVVLMLNDIKSRLTPPEVANAPLTEKLSTIIKP